MKSISDGGESSQKDRGRPRKTVREAIRKDLEVNEFDPNMVYDNIMA